MSLLTSYCIPGHQLLRTAAGPWGPAGTTHRWTHQDGQEQPTINSIQEESTVAAGYQEVEEKTLFCVLKLKLKVFKSLMFSNIETWKV